MRTDEIASLQTSLALSSCPECLSVLLTFFFLFALKRKVSHFINGGKPNFRHLFRVPGSVDWLIHPLPGPYPPVLHAHAHTRTQTCAPLRQTLWVVALNSRKPHTYTGFSLELGNITFIFSLSSERILLTFGGNSMKIVWRHACECTRRTRHRGSSWPPIWAFGVPLLFWLLETGIFIWNRPGSRRRCQLASPFSRWCPSWRFKLCQTYWPWLRNASRSFAFRWRQLRISSGFVLLTKRQTRQKEPQTVHRDGRIIFARVDLDRSLPPPSNFASRSLMRQPASRTF